MSVRLVPDKSPAPPPTAKFLPQHEAHLPQDANAAQPHASMLLGSHELFLYALTFAHGLQLRDGAIGWLEAPRTQMAYRRLYEHYSHLIHSDID